ncbi:MAG: undecaprenyl-phosphate glucose phosphotransferase [Leptonema sp. (in: Bacteria)]|nr:undecaprenyl-phosphate glucose phosphotransferase [Leptonema sp. (in: bacteria)]
MIRERKQTLKLSLLSFDLVISFFAFWSAFFLHFYVIAPDRQLMVLPSAGFIVSWFNQLELFQSSLHLHLMSSYAPLSILFVISQLVVFVAVDQYRTIQSSQSLRELLSIVRSVTIALVLMLAILFFYRGQSYSRLVILYAAMLSVVYLTIGHWLFRWWIFYLRGRGYNVRQVLVVGAGQNAVRFIENLEQYSLFGYRIQGVIGPKQKMAKTLNQYRIGGYSDLHSICESQQIDTVVVAIDGVALSKEVRPIVDYCYREGIDCRIVPDMLDLVTHRARIEDMNGLPVLSLRDIPLNNGYHRFVKRAFDIGFSSMVLILTSPILILLALIVKLSSKGPIFFVQERVGLDRKKFRLIKFRTMTVQQVSESDTIWGSKDDVRVTAIGKFLRKTSLDELPQFINVFIGNMSVVGPRPERPHFVQKFKETYDRYMLRHSVKSGITGWAQILGFRGDTSIEKRIEADIYYIENWSLLFDILIVLRTIPSMIKNPGE